MPAPIVSKVCKKCGIEKPLSDFYKHPSCKDGHLGKCKACHKAAQAAYVAKNRDRVRTYHREYARKNRNAPSRVRAKAKYMQSDTYSERNARYKRENREKANAHRLVKYAVDTGKLIRHPCETCGTSDNIHAHHDDYSKPLDVRWLCAAHHAQLHANQRASNCRRSGT